MLYETLSQPQIFLFVVLFGFINGIIFDIFKIFKNCIKNRFFINFLTFFNVFLVILIYFFVNLKFNYGEFRFYILLSFFLSLFIERLFIGNLLGKFLEKCYNKVSKGLKGIYENKIRKRKNRKNIK